MTGKIVAMRLALVALVVLASQVPARASDFCSEAAARIRAGEADGPVKFGYGSNAVIPVLASRASRFIHIESDSRESVGETLTKWHATQALVNAAKSTFGPDYGSANIIWFGKSGAAAIEAIEGTAYCTYMLFFDTSSGRAREVAPPVSLSFGEATVCWNSAAWIGKVSSFPLLMQEDDSNDSNGTTSTQLTLVPWQGHRWGKTCHISASFTAPLAVIGAFCKKDIDCGAMRSKALALAQNMESGEAGGGTREMFAPNIPKPLSDLASKTPELDQLPTFGDSPLSPYTTFATKKLFAMPAAGTGDIVVIGSGSWGWREFPGYWLPSGARLAAHWNQWQDSSSSDSEERLGRSRPDGRRCRSLTPLPMVLAP